MKHSYILLAFTLSAFAFSATKDDQTILVSGEDQEMNSAISKAQATLDDFLQLKANPPSGASGFKLKVKITDKYGIEHMWVTPFQETDGGFIGVLADTPEYVRSVKNGQTLKFSRPDVTDWGYVLDGKQKGSFTVCVLFKHMPAVEVEQYRHDYGFEC